MLIFRSASVPADNDRLTVVNYGLSHATPGRGGTHLNLNVRLTHAFGSITAVVTDLAPKVETDDPEMALDKLADWLDRSAKALRARGKPKAFISTYSPD